MYKLACCYALEGQAVSSLEWLQKVIERDACHRTLARSDPDYDLIRADPRFRALVGE